MPTDKFTPAVGQGCVAIEAAKNLDSDKVDLIRKYVNNVDTERCLRAERAYLKTLEGGCSIPVFGLARIKNQQIELNGGIISLNGQDLVRHRVTGGLDDGANIGQQLAELVLQDGGGEILSEIKANL
jgi:hydroxymethylbilane synthase